MTKIKGIKTTIVYIILAIALILALWSIASVPSDAASFNDYTYGNVGGVDIAFPPAASPNFLTYVYANGIALVIESSGVYIDADRDGVLDSGETLVCELRDSLYIYGGAYENDITANVLITMNSGSVAGLFGGNREGGTATGNSRVVVNGGTITSFVCGSGSGESSILGSVTVEINGGNMTGELDGTNAATGGIISGDVTVTVNGGTVSNLYAVNRKTVQGNVFVKILGGYVGELNITSFSEGGMEGNLDVLVKGGELSKLRAPTSNRAAGSVTVSVYQSGECTLTSTAANYVDNLFVKGDDGKYHIKGTVEIPADVTETVPESVALEIPEGSTLINNGTLICNGAFTNNGTFTPNGTVQCNSHTYTDGVCNLCSYECTHPFEGRVHYLNITSTEHTAELECCGKQVVEEHSFSSDSGECEKCGKAALFMVDGTGYMSFTEALEGWTDGSTLKLFADAEYTEQIKIIGIEVTLDLNGHILDMSSVSAAIGSGTAYDEGASVTVKDSAGGGQLYSKSRALTAHGGNVLTLLGGTIHGSIYAGGTVNISGGEVYSVTYNGSELRGNNSAIQLVSEGVLNISGGVIVGRHGIFAYSGEVNVSGSPYIRGIDVDHVNVGYAMHVNSAVTISGTPILVSDSGPTFVAESAFTLNTLPPEGTVWSVKLNAQNIDEDGVFAIAGEELEGELNPDCFRSGMEGHIIEKTQDGNLRLKVCTHSGGTATCLVKKTCLLCGLEYGELAGHITEDEVSCSVCHEDLLFAIIEGDSVVYHTEMLELWEFSPDAVLKLLSDIALEKTWDTGSGGSSVIDLNGFTVSAAENADFSGPLFKASSESAYIIIIDSSESKSGAIDFDGTVFAGTGMITVEESKFPSGLRLQDGQTLSGILPEGGCYGVVLTDSNATELSGSVTIAKHKFLAHSDATHHWSACACGENLGKAEHTGGVASCTSPKLCETCGSGYGELAADSHSWNGGIVTTAPTCTEEGVKTFTCQHNSSHTRTEPIAAVGHSYDNDCDTDCNSCAETREVPEHTDADGDRLCDSCLTPLGLSAGAIVGITLGSVAVAGVGLFSLFWFVIRKRLTGKL